MKVLYLYAEVMGYTIATMKALVRQSSQLHVVHWDHKKKSEYKLREEPEIRFYSKSSLSREDIVRLAWNINPDITVVSGWSDPDYLSASRKLRRKGKIVVCGLDGQWRGDLRQRIGSFIARNGYLRRFFSHAWVAGVFQYEYARKFGFSQQEIIFDLYSADTEIFSQQYLLDKKIRAATYPHRFLYVGRYEPEKGLDTLIRAWDSLVRVRKDWELHFIGNGTLKSMLLNSESVVVNDFLQPEELVFEASRAGCFILPSRFEPWAVVVQEFAALGLPLLLSDAVGASSVFLIEGYNGFRFPVNDAEELGCAMKRIIDTSDEKLIEFGKASRRLAVRISPESSAANLLSLTE